MKRTAVLPAPTLRRPLPRGDKWDDERRAFRRLLPSLVRSHRGKYVAIHQSKVVDTDADQVALALRAYERFGYLPIYVGQVSVEPPRPARIPSPRLTSLC